MTDNPYIVRAREIAAQHYCEHPHSVGNEPLAQRIASAMAEAAAPLRAENEKLNRLSSMTTPEMRHLRAENAALRLRCEAAEDCCKETHQPVIQNMLLENAALRARIEAAISQIASWGNLDPQEETVLRILRVEGKP